MPAGVVRFEQYGVISVGYNLRLVLAWLRMILCFIFVAPFRRLNWRLETFALFSSAVRRHNCCDFSTGFTSKICVDFELGSYLKWRCRLLPS